MVRDWPAKDMAPLIMLIADPRHKLSDDGTYRLSEEQAKAILELRLARLTALGRDEIADELKKIADEIKEYLAILASRARVVEIVKSELTAIRAEFATPRKTEIIDIEGEVEDEDLIQREDCVVTVIAQGLHQARAARHLSGAEARRQGPLRHVDARRGFRHAALRGLDAHAGAVLLLARHVLPHEGLAAAGGIAAVARQGARQPPAAAAGRGHHLDPAAAGRFGDMGRAGADLRHAVRQRAAQRAVRFREHQPQRQDRDEARRGRSHRRGRDLHARERRAADDGAMATASASSSKTRCACSRAAIATACAASGSTRATRSSRWRSSTTSRRRPKNVLPI